MANEEQAVVWTDVVGDAWVDHASTYDAMLGPIGLAAMDRLDPSPGDRVLDIGCGTGETTVELTRRVTAGGADGSVVGVDLSSRMLGAARARAADAGVTAVEFVEADVQTADLGRHRFDRAFSRMGVMFFSDPSAAFTNIAGALRPGGRLAFCCFQDLGRNEAIAVPLLSVAEMLALPPVDLSLPGPFSLADADKTTGLLQRAGFVDITLTEGPESVALTGVTDLRDMARQMIEQNPFTNPPFAAADDATRAAALDAVAATLEPHRVADTLTLAMGIWIVSALAAG